MGSVVYKLLVYWFILLFQTIYAHSSYKHLNNDVCRTKECIRTAQQIEENLDLSVDPCTNFYKYTCGNFNAQIKKTQPEYNSNFGLVQYKVDKYIQMMFNDHLNNTSNEHWMILLRDHFNMCKDIDKIKELGVQPLLKQLEQVGGWPVLLGDKWDEDHFDWVEMINKFNQMGYENDYLLQIYIDKDVKDESKKMIKVDGPDIHLSKDDLSKGMSDKKTTNLLRFIEDVALLLGADKETAKNEILDVYAKNEILDVYALEASLTLASLPAESQTNKSDLHYPLTIAALSKRYKHIPWKRLINNLLVDTQIEDDDEINITSLPFIRRIDKILKDIPKRTLANYIVWRIVYKSIKYLDDEFNEMKYEHLNFYYNTSYEAREKECISRTIYEFPKFASTLYVMHYFNAEAKEAATDIFKRVHDSFIKILEKIDWMDSATKEKAIKKAIKMGSTIGYPEEILDATNFKDDISFDFNRDSYLEGVLSKHAYDIRNYFRDYRKPYDTKDKWTHHVNCLDVNAFYYPDLNHMEIPAAILHEPFFHKNRPKYLNFGSMGFVIGHEITHGFDNVGRQYTRHGRIHNWWKSEALKKFLIKAKCIIKQYGNYILKRINMNVNGILTEGENIADNGGIREAYKAYNSWTEENGEELPLPGLNYTTRQLFWLSAASIYCGYSSKYDLLIRVLTDPHSPPEFRVNGAFSNTKYFAKDFNCPVGSPMNPKHKCVVW